MKDSISNNLLLVVGGPGSSGSSTIARMLAEHYDIERVYAGGVFRDTVSKLGYPTLDSFYDEGDQQKFFEVDRQVDELLIERANRGNVLIESKVFGALATINNIECSAKIWLDASLPVRVKRYVAKQGEMPFFKKILLYIATWFHLSRRRREDGLRYKELYGVDYNNQNRYNDIVIDTSDMNERETFDLILKKLNDGGFITK